MKLVKCFASGLTLLLFWEPQCTYLLPKSSTISFRGLQCVEGARQRNGSSEAMEQEDAEETNHPSDEDMEGVLENPSAAQQGVQQQPQQSEGDDSPSCSDAACGPAVADTYKFNYSSTSDSSDSESSPRQARKLAKGVQTSFSHLRAAPMVTRTQQHSPAGAAEARIVTSQVSGLLRPLSRKGSRSRRFGRTKKRALTLPTLAHSVKAFLLPVPKRRTGFQEPMKSYSVGAVNVIRYVSSLFPLKFKSALHDGTMKVLSADWSRPVIYSPGRVSVCVNFEREENFPPFYLTMLFIENRKHLGQDASRLMYRVGAAQQLALRAGLKRAADIGPFFHMGTPVDVVPLSDKDVVELDSTYLSGKGLLEPRLWAPLTSVLRRIDQAEGMKLIRLADQARSSLTQQVVDVVSGIRARRFVLPRVAPEDFWVDESGQLYYLPRDTTNLLSEGDSVKSPSAAAQSEASTSAAASALGTGGEVLLSERSNSVALAFFIMQMWCRLTPEQSRAQTPAREVAATEWDLGFNSCISGMPQEVKQLLVLLHGGRMSPSLPTADAATSKPYLALQSRLEYTEALEQGSLPRRSHHAPRSLGSSRTSSRSGYYSRKQMTL